MNKKLISLVLILCLILTVCVADSSVETIDTLESLKEIIQSDYYKDVDESVLINGAIRGMFEALDQHSTYMNEEEFKDFQVSTSGEFGGVGVQIERKNDRITVVSPIEGTPGFAAGLMTGDIIVSVDDTDIKEYTLEQAVSIIRGEVGTKVKLGIIKSGQKDVEYITIVRDNIKIESVKTESPYRQGIKNFTKDERVAYIRLTEFDQNTYSDFRDKINEYKEQGKKGLIIDLRYNPGGLLDSVVKICGEIIPKGPIVHIDAKGDSDDEILYSDLLEAPFKIVVIVNEGSASASEILTGAVKDSGVGKIVGSKTYGKGTVQNISYLTNGGAVKLTIAEYMTRNDVHIDGKGIEPDVKVEPLIKAELANVGADRTLKIGTIGIDVYGIQQRLKNLGYNIKIDGIMGKNTLSAANDLIIKNGGKKAAVLDIESQKKIIDLYKNSASESIVDVELQTAVSELLGLLDAK